MDIRYVDPEQLLTATWQEFLERRLWFALSRYQSRIRRVVATVRDENASRGGIEKVCRIEVRLNDGAEVVVEDGDAELEACLSRAASRAGRTVARRVSRLVDPPRHRSPRAT